MYSVIKEELLNDFLTLVQIDSPSKDERAVADWLTEKFRSMGCEVTEDDTGKAIGGNCGNLKVKLKGNALPGKPLFFSSHMDTVEPAHGIEPVIEDGIIRSKGETILGSDDKAGIATMLNLIRMVNANPDIPRPDLEFSLNVSEEIGLLGAKHLDTSDFNAVAGYVLDDHDPKGITIQSPSASRINYRVIGRAAHAGVEPEKGINAFKVASVAVAKMKLGRIDDETTANIGAVHGGSMSNIVLETLDLKAEARSHNPEKLEEQIRHMDACFEEACTEFRAEGEDVPRVEIDRKAEYEAVQLTPDDYPVKLAIEAAKKLGWEMELKKSGGGTDGSVINSKGIPCTVLGVGMQNVHSTKEYVRISDMEDAARLLAAIVETHLELNQ